MDNRFAYWRDQQRPSDTSFCIIRRKADHIEVDRDILTVALAWKALGADTLFIGEARTQEDWDSAWLTCSIEVHNNFSKLVEACRMPPQDVRMIFTQLKRLKIIYPDGTVHQSMLDLANTVYSGM